MFVVVVESAWYLHICSTYFAELLLSYILNTIVCTKANVTGKKFCTYLEIKISKRKRRNKKKFCEEKKILKVRSNFSMGSNLEKLLQSA